MGRSQETQDGLAARFAEHRAHLLGVAYRLTGSRADAEDALQESWLRLSALDESRREAIQDLRGWLTTVIGHLCLDRLRSAAARRERYVGQWLPEPIVTQLSDSTFADPLDAVVRDDEVRLAAMVVLDRLTPEQRVAFVLHDAFSVPFAQIAATLGCSEAAARQHASRGRRELAEADPPARSSLAEQRDVIERFVPALLSGDLAEVVNLLHPDVVLIGDSGGQARTARQIVHGPDKVARFLLGLAASYGEDRITAGELVLVNGDLGMLLPDIPADDEYRALTRRVTCFTLAGGRIQAIYDIANPDKLTRLPSHRRAPEPGTPHPT